MDNRGYQLNAITLLFEAVGFYCLDSLCKIKSVKKREKSYRYFIKQGYTPKHIFSTYTMVNDARVITKIKDRFKILNNRQFINRDNIKDDIIVFLNKIENLDDFKNFIESMEAFRNNLTHGNSSQAIDDVKETYENMLNDFENFCIKQNILKKK